MSHAAREEHVLAGDAGLDQRVARGAPRRKYGPSICAAGQREQRLRLLRWSELVVIDVWSLLYKLKKFQSSALAQAGALDERLEFRPHDGRMDALRHAAAWAKPQSVPAITFSRPTSLAKRTMRSATRRGCSTVVTWWVMTPGIRIWPVR